MRFCWFSPSPVKLLSKHDNPLSASEICTIANATKGYSCSDLINVAREAAFGPLRGFKCKDLLKDVKTEEVRSINLSDFTKALQRIRPSVDSKALEALEAWNAKYGDISA